MLEQIKKRLSSACVAFEKSSMQRRFHRATAGTKHCYISQNCVGGRFYNMQDRAYTSPTIGLWFEPSDFLSFCENLDANLKAELICDDAESQKMCYPVGRVNGIKVLFLHYASFAEAKGAWEKRAARVSKDNVFILMTDKEGFTDHHLQRFVNLPTEKKILFINRPIKGNANAIYVPGYENEDCVGDLFGDYHKLNRLSVRGKLFRLLRQG